MKDADFLGWYNGEIDRYRDHEWQLAVFSIGWSYGNVLFAINPGNENEKVVPFYISIILILVVGILIAIAEIHTHIKLNEYRERRDILLDKKDHRNEKLKFPFCKTLFDYFYISCFLFIPFIFMIGAVVCVLNKYS